MTGSVALRFPRPLALALAAFLALGAALLLIAARPTVPDQLTRALETAKGGETLTLAPATYGVVTLPKRKFSPRLKIDARSAKFAGLVLEGVEGVEIFGGEVDGPGGKSYGVSISQSRDIAIRDMRVSGAHRGIVVSRSQKVALSGNNLTGLISDGINIAFSQHVQVIGNRCSNFSPLAATYDAKGTMIQDGDHADCIQAWSRPHLPPTGDLLIENNQIDGVMQGIFLGNHVRDGVDDGGFDRVVIRNNRVRISKPTGIRVIGLRGGEVTGNIVQTIPGSMMLNNPTRAVRTNMSVDGVARVCGNMVEAVPRGEGRQPCA